VDLGGGRRALHDQLRQQPVQDLRERRHPGPEGEVDDARPVGDGHADVAHQHAVAVAEFGQGTGEMAVEDPVLLHRAATSAAVGKDTCAPCFVTVAAPTRAAYAAASARDSPAPRRQASAAVNASPAPVVSTARTATDGTRTVPSAEATSAPSPPSVTTTDRGPFASSSRAQSSGSSLRPPASPRMTFASCSLTISGSQAASTSVGRGCGGDGLRTNRPPGARQRTTSTTVSSGSANCADTTREAWKRLPAARTSCGASRPLAPGETTMLLSPDGSTVISATPVGAPPTSTPTVSTPADRCESSSSRPCASSPTRASRAVRAPSRAAATAWLAPLPPGWTARSEPSTVSPAAGRRSTPITRSALADPTTRRS